MYYYLTESKHNTIQVTEAYLPHYCEGLPAQGGRGAGGGGGVCGRCCQRWCGCGGHIVSVSHWCLAAAQCTTAAALRSCASTGHHTPHRHSWSRAAGGTNSVHPRHNNRVHIVPFPITSMEDERTPSKPFLQATCPAPAGAPRPLLPSLHGPSSAHTQYWPPLPTTTQLFALNGSAFAYIWCKYR